MPDIFKGTINAHYKRENNKKKRFTFTFTFVVKVFKMWTETSFATTELLAI